MANAGLPCVLIALDMRAGSARPPAGLVLTWPYATAPGATTRNGQPVTWSHGELRIEQLPATLRVVARD